MKKIIRYILSTGLLTLCIVGTANSALIERLGGLAYYDTEANLTWLADANYSFTSGYAASEANGDVHSSPINIQADGTMGWEAANTWVTGLKIGGVTDWRLPTTLQPDISCSRQDSHGSYYDNCTGSEMGNLFYNVLGGTAGYDISTSHNDNYYLFTNISTTNSNWSSTQAYDTGAWSFAFRSGNQRSFNTAVSNYSWAVHDGDVSAVPVPAAVWLFGSGLIGLVGFVRRKKA